MTNVPLLVAWGPYEVSVCIGTAHQGVTRFVPARQGIGLYLLMCSTNAQPRLQKSPKPQVKAQCSNVVPICCCAMSSSVVLPNAGGGGVPPDSLHEAIHSSIVCSTPVGILLGCGALRRLHGQRSLWHWGFVVEGRTCGPGDSEVSSLKPQEGQVPKSSQSP